jgi:hypothetical protein
MTQDRTGFPTSAVSRRGLLGAAVVGSSLVASRSSLPSPAWGENFSQVQAGVGKGKDAPETLVWVSVAAFLSVPQRIAVAAGKAVDCTDAFVAAFAKGRHVWVPPGRYGVSTIRLRSGEALIGAGSEATVIEQMVADQPAIACIADSSTGQIAGVTVAGIFVAGHARASGCAVRVVGLGAYAVWRSSFQFFASHTYTALEIGIDNTNVFRCDFDVVSENTRGTAVIARGGVYNRYRYFLTQTAGMALEDHSGSSEIEAVAESCMIFHGQINRVWATIEALVASPVPSRTLIEDRGFQNRFYSPTVNLRAEDRGKCTYAFAPFSGSIFDDPQVLGRDTVEHPFAPSPYGFTVIAGRSEAAQPIEATYDGREPARNLRNVALIGVNHGLTRTPLGIGARAIQRAAPDAPFNFAINPRTDVVMWEPRAPLAFVNVSLMAGATPFDGWAVAFTTTQPIARVNWPGGEAYAALPTRMDPGAGFTLLYDGVAKRWKQI